MRVRGADFTQFFACRKFMAASEIREIPDPGRHTRREGEDVDLRRQPIRESWDDPSVWL